MKTTISLDNSSLCLVVKTDASLDEFFKILDSQTITVNVPSDSLMELANGKWIHNSTEQQGVSYRLQRFVRLATRYLNERKILLNELPQKIIENEINSPCIKHFSVASVEGDKIALFEIDNHEQIHLKVLEAHESRKKVRSMVATKDKEANESNIISSESAEKLLKSFNSTQADPEWRKFLHGQFSKWIFGERVSLELFDKILDSENCLVVKTFVDLISVHHLAVFLDSNASSEDIKPLIEIDENSLPDILIASMAAYSDYFISEDKTLKARCNFLRNLGRIKFETKTLNEFSSFCHPGKHVAH